MENNINNINEEQPVTSPIQETPIQTQDMPPIETTPVETKEKSNSKKVIIVFLILLFLISLAAAAYIFIIKPKSKNVEPVVTDKNIPATNNIVPQNDNVSTESPFGKLTDANSSNNSGCNNMECLIEAVKNCQPTTITITYSDKPNNLLGAFGISEDVVFSGKTVYEIKNPDGGNICSLYTSNPSSSASFSEESKKKLIELGSTEEQISELLKTVNYSLNLIEVRQSKTLCTGDRSIIVEFLADSEKGNVGVETESSNLGASKSTYTTSSGKKLECITELPPKLKANTNTQITSQECETKSGNVRYMEESGEACYVGETDLGKIVNKNVTMTPSMQCCVGK